MASEVILYGPDSEAYNMYSIVSPAPGAPSNSADRPGAPAYRFVRPLGTQLVLQDGRKFRFAMGGGTLVVGNMLTAGVATASQQNLSAATGAVGDRIITLTTGASTAQNVFAEGFVAVSVTPGLGDCYKIASHLVMTSGAGDILNLWPGHALRRALTSVTSKLDLTDNIFSRVIQSPATTVASAPVGGCVSLLTTSLSGWIQTRGVFCGLTSGTAIAGDSVSTGLGTAGALGPIGDNTQDTSPAGLAWCIFAAASGAGSTFYLTIDG